MTKRYALSATNLFKQHSIMVKTSKSKQAYLRLNGIHKLKVAEIFELYSPLLYIKKM